MNDSEGVKREDKAICGQSPPQLAASAPWSNPLAFGGKPQGYDYGCKKGRKTTPCDREELIELCSRAKRPEKLLVWTPDTPGLVPLAEVPFLSDIIERENRKLIWAFVLTGMICFLFFGSIVFLLWKVSNKGFQIFPFLLLVIFGVIPLVEGLYRMWTYAPASPHKEVNNARFRIWLMRQKIPYTWIIAILIITVFVFQMRTGMRVSVEAAGLVKHAVRQGQVWRLLTSSLLHGNLLHILFNFLALLYLGRHVECLSSKAHLLFVFVVGALVSSVFSLVLLPQGTSIGASGGLMGLIGFLAVMGYRRKSILPASFLNSILKSIVLIFAVGIIAYRYIDNAGHLGGLVAGVVIGILLVKDKEKSVPLKPGNGLVLAGKISFGIIIGTGVVTIMLFMI